MWGEGVSIEDITKWIEQMGLYQNNNNKKRKPGIIKKCGGK